MNCIVATVAVATALMAAPASADEAKPLTFTVKVIASPSPAREFTARTTGVTLIPTPLLGWFCEAGIVGPPRMTAGHLVQSMAVDCESAAGKATSFVACRLTSEVEVSSSSFALEDAHGHSVFLQSFCSNGPLPQ